MSEANLVKDKAERIARNNRLEGIFIPYARQRRDEMYDTQGMSARFVHYTTAEAAIKIISSKKLWMRNALCMADYREVQHGYDILLRLFGNKPNADSFKEVLDRIHSGAASEAIGIFDQHWASRVIQFNTFITSVSEHDEREDRHGRLSMWRAFGNSPARVAIVIKVPYASEGAQVMELRFSPVAYFSDVESNTLLPEVTKRVEKNAEFLKGVTRKEIINWVFYMLIWHVTCIKHEGFREEREWRVVLCPKVFPPSPLIESSTEIVAGIPQLLYKLPLDKKVNSTLADLDLATLFDRLIIGPSQYSPAMLEALFNALTNAGVTDPQNKIFPSNIPIRSYP